MFRNVFFICLSPSQMNITHFFLLLNKCTGFSILMKIYLFKDAMDSNFNDKNKNPTDPTKSTVTRKDLISKRENVQIDALQ